MPTTHNNAARTHGIIAIGDMYVTSTVLNHPVIERPRQFGRFSEVFVVPATLSRCSNTATPLVRSIQSWTYFKMMLLPFGSCGNVHTAIPASSPARTRGNKCSSL